MNTNNSHNAQADHDQHQRLINITLYRLEEMLDYEMTKDRPDLDGADEARLEEMFFDLVQIKAELSSDSEETDSDYIQDLMAYVKGSHDMVSYLYSAYIQRDVNDMLERENEEDMILDLISENSDKYADFGELLLRD